MNIDKMSKQELLLARQFIHALGEEKDSQKDEDERIAIIENTSDNFYNCSKEEKGMLRAVAIMSKDARSKMLDKINCKII